jgi:hypothetical protein
MQHEHTRRSTHCTQDFCERCDSVREKTGISKQKFRKLLWEDWVSFLRTNQTEILETSGTAAEQNTAPEHVIPVTRADFIRQAFPTWTPQNIRAAMTVEDEVVPLFFDGRIDLAIFAGDAGWALHKQASFQHVFLYTFRVFADTTSERVTQNERLAVLECIVLRAVGVQCSSADSRLRVNCPLRNIASFRFTS